MDNPKKLSIAKMLIMIASAIFLSVSVQAQQPQPDSGGKVVTDPSQPINVTLAPDADVLEDVVVVAYGSHPNDYGYTLWAKSIEKPLLKILKKHGIK